MFNNPDLLVLCVVGDGEAETGPLAASWHSNKFLNPARDGAMLAVSHLARSGEAADRPAWPMIVLRTPKGWIGPREMEHLCSVVASLRGEHDDP